MFFSTAALRFFLNDQESVLIFILVVVGSPWQYTIAKNRQLWQSTDQLQGLG